MGWFSKKKENKDNTKPSNMSPLEAVTHLCASIQLADGKLDYEERSAWIDAIRQLFPEFREERADKFLKEAQHVLQEKNGEDKKFR